MDVLIVGCGYLGLELGRQLASRDHDVVGVRRSEAGLEAVEAAGLTPARADVTEPATLASLPDAEWLVYAASAGRTTDQTRRGVYVEGLEATITEFGGRETPPDRLVYTSSTGVYGDHDGAWVDESTPLSPQTDRQRALVDAESVALDAVDSGIDATVARLGGIYGPDRYRIDPYLDGPVTEGYLNLVHRDDAAGAIAHLLETDCGRNEVVQVVDDEPVDRVDFARWFASELDKPAPATRSRAQLRADKTVPESAKERRIASKRCRNDRLHEYGYEFTYPTFREGYESALAEWEDRNR